MGAHHLADAEATSLTRAAGRGALVASTALALTGAGAGLALAHGNDSGHGSGDDDTSSSRTVSSSEETCSSDAAQGLLGDLGLTSSADELCGTASGSSAPSHRSSATDTAGSSAASTPSAGSTPTGSTPTGSAPARATAASFAPTNPDDIPPAPGETKVIDLPDHPSGSGHRAR